MKKLCTTKSNVAKLPELVALYLDKIGCPALPWEKPEGARPIVVRAGEKGYHPVNPRLNVDHFNSTADNGKPATRQQIHAMLNGSMFGFHCPAADTDEYDAGGNLRATPIDSVELAKADLAHFVGAGKAH